MLTPRKIALAGLIFSALLTGCAEPKVVTRVEIQRVQIPAALTTCAAFPAIPAGPVTFADLIVTLARAKAAWLDCSYRLGRVKELSAP